MSDITLFTKFYAYLLTEKRVAANTYAAYKRDLAQFQQFLVKQEITLQQVLLRDLKFFLKYLKDIKVGPRSVARKISALKLLFKYLHDHLGWENKAEEISFPKFKKSLPTYLSEQEIETLLTVADNDSSDVSKRNKMLLYLLYVTGARISELIQLTIDDIRFDTGFISINGKGGKQRMVPIPPPMLELLQTYINQVHVLFVRKHQQTNYLFPILYKGKVKPISRQSCWIMLQGMWLKTGLKKSISPHMLRHSLATHMLKNGADLRALQLMLGHETIATVQIYTHVETSHVRQVYDEKHPRSE